MSHQTVSWWFAAHVFSLLVNLDEGTNHSARSTLDADFPNRAFSIHSSSVCPEAELKRVLGVNRFQRTKKAMRDD